MESVERGGAVELARGVYWVGAISWNERDFHGFTIPEGTTYNAYLVAGEKNALIGTVKEDFAGEMIERIKEIINPVKIDYIVINHLEMDHSGTLQELKKHTDARIFITRRGRSILDRYFESSGLGDRDFQVVRTGDQLILEGKTLVFLEATMLRWPDSMETFLIEDNILFSSDIFGQHIASSGRYDYESGNLIPVAAEYYANTFMPFGVPLLRHLERLKKFGITPKQIAPSHGAVWKRDLEEIQKAYTFWANGKVKEKVLVVYDTMSGSTGIMAKEIAEAARKAGVEVKLLQLRKNTRNRVMKEMLDTAAFAVGSPTLNNGVLPQIADFLAYLKGLHPQKKIAAAFGSYGWGGGAVKDIEEELKKAGIELLKPGIQARYMPDDRELEMCRDLGRQLAGIAKKQNNTSQEKIKK